MKLSRAHFRPGNGRRRAAVAQLVEHVIRNDGVVGSSPISGTSFSSQFARRIYCWLLAFKLSEDPPRQQRAPRRSGNS